jgi:hypothetical protein
VFNLNTNQFSETAPGDLGMHVEVKDPEGKMVLSRVRHVRWQRVFFISSWNLIPFFPSAFQPFSLFWGPAFA